MITCCHRSASAMPKSAKRGTIFIGVPSWGMPNPMSFGGRSQVNSKREYSTVEGHDKRRCWYRRMLSVQEMTATTTENGHSVWKLKISYSQQSTKIYLEMSHSQIVSTAEKCLH